LERKPMVINSQVNSGQAMMELLKTAYLDNVKLDF
jgi:hypothetical protein